MAPLVPAHGQADTKPVNAIQGIVDAFDRYPVVAIAENPHWLRQAGDFYVSLVKDSRFNTKVNDLVVEFASRNYQPVVDRYVGGENMPIRELQQVWRDSTKVMSWESPIYRELLKAVREVNRTLPAARRLRVLAGDSPIDWQKIQSNEDWSATQPNNNSFSWVIVNEVLQKHRKALVILGSNHLTKSGDRDGYPDTTTLVEDQHPGSMFVVLMLGRISVAAANQQHLDSLHWKAPSLIPLSGTSLGAISIPSMGTKLQQVADALLYLGPPASLSTAQPDWNTLKGDSAYMKELARRYRVVYGCDFDQSKLGSMGRPCH